MTRITFDNNRVVMRDDKVGSEQSCCCGDQPPFCPDSCDEELTVNASIGGMTATVTVPVPGAGASRFNKNDGSGDYVEVDATIVCGTYGPGGALAWAVFVSVCYQSGGFLNGEAFGAVVGLQPNGCPNSGDVGLACSFGGCAANANGNIG